MPLTKDKPIKQLNEYKITMKNLLIEKNKSFDYVSGYITCLKEHNHLSIFEALELLKFTSTIYFKKMGWEK